MGGRKSAELAIFARRRLLLVGLSCTFSQIERVLMFDVSSERNCVARGLYPATGVSISRWNVNTISSTGEETLHRQNRAYRSIT